MDKSQLERLMIAMSKLEESPSTELKIMLLCIRAKEDITSQVAQMVEDSKTEKELLDKIKAMGWVLPKLQQEQEAETKITQESPL